MSVPAPPDRRSGLTLIELLAAVTIATALATMATVSFVQIQKAQQRLQARLRMHETARFIHQHLSEDLTAFEQDGAYWVETTADTGQHTGSVSLTFLRGKLDEHDFASRSWRYWPGEAMAVYQTRCTDLTWCCWSWDQHTQTLATGVCSPPRAFHILGGLTGGPNGTYTTWFLNMPQPLRQCTPYPAALPIGSSAAALGANRFGSQDAANDLSDYADLRQNMAPIATHVTDLHLELVESDGTVVDADASASKVLGFDGVFVSGQCTPGAVPGDQPVAPHTKRPRLLRLLYDVTDPQTGLTQSFSFSFRIANVLPKTYPTGTSIP